MIFRGFHLSWWLGLFPSFHMVVVLVSTAHHHRSGWLEDRKPLLVQTLHISKQHDYVAHMQHLLSFHIHCFCVADRAGVYGGAHLQCGCCPPTEELAGNTPGPVTSKRQWNRPLEHLGCCGGGRSVGATTSKGACTVVMMMTPSTRMYRHCFKMMEAQQVHIIY